MAGSSKQESIKCPNGAKSSKSPKSPKTPKRERKAKSVVVNREDYNIRSPERTQLLTQIKGKIDNVLVSPAFWACCQLADMNCLQELTGSNQTMILFAEKQFCALPMLCELLGFCIWL
jgi:hypothetical protein